MTLREENEVARNGAIDKVARALGLWADPDGFMFLVEADGKLTLTRRIPIREDLARAQSYAVWLTQKVDALEVELAGYRAMELGKMGVVGEGIPDAIAS